jgi:RNA exonuclease 1
MFSTLGLFRNLPCPQRDTCSLQNCLYSHSPNLPNPTPLKFVQAPTPVASTSSTPTKTQAKSVVIVPAKRPATSPIKKIPASASTEPPAKLQKVGPTQRSTAIPSATRTEVSVGESLQCLTSYSYASYSYA